MKRSTLKKGEETGEDSNLKSNNSYRKLVPEQNYLCQPMPPKSKSTSTEEKRDEKTEIPLILQYLNKIISGSVTKSRNRSYRNKSRGGRGNSGNISTIT